MNKGIYIIENTINGKKYIGSDSNIDKSIRWNDHKSKLKRGKHYNLHLQRAWNQYGEQNFKYYVKKVFNNITSEQLSDIEQKYLEDAKLNKDQYYNTVFGVRNYTRKVEKLNRTKEELNEMNRIRRNRHYYSHQEEEQKKSLQRYHDKKKLSDCDKPFSL